MASHDNYDKDVLKALQRIANSLEKIEKKMPDKPIKTMNELRESSGLSKVDDTCPSNIKTKNDCKVEHKSCLNCKYAAFHLRDEPCYSCDMNSNYVERRLNMKRIFVMLLSLSIIFGSMREVDARELPGNQSEMADKIAQIAIDNYDKYGVLPSVCVAQAFIESTLGEHMSNTHNYFGIKSGAVGYSSLEDGVIGYLKVINNGLYDGALFNKSYESSIAHILNGGYCQPAGDYYFNATWSIETYNFDKYDEKLWKKKAEEKRKDKWEKKYTFIYDPNVPDNKVMVDEEIIKGGTITSYVNDIPLIVDVIPGSKGREIRTNIPELDGCKACINVYENAVG